MKNKKFVENNLHDIIKKMSSESKIKILIVDDNELTRIHFRDIFWIHGYNSHEVEAASSLSEAEKIINDKNRIPNILFLDVLLPIEGEKNNIDAQVERSMMFIKKIKEDKELSKIKIVIYSTHKEQLIKNKFSDIKVDGYLAKGENMPKEILSFVKQIYERNNN